MMMSLTLDKAWRASTWLYSDSTFLQQQSDIFVQVSHTLRCLSPLWDYAKLIQSVQSKLVLLLVGTLPAAQLEVSTVRKCRHQHGIAN